MAAIAEEWFQRLLHETPEVEAIHTVAQFWSHRLDLEHVQFGLSLPEYRIQLALIYTGEVGNGGHDQFFENRGRDRLPDTVDALLAVELRPLADVLRQAAAGGGGRDRLDREAWALLSGLEPALVAYARAHEGEVLVLERRAV